MRPKHPQNLKITQTITERQIHIRKIISIIAQTAKAIVSESKAALFE